MILMMSHPLNVGGGVGQLFKGERLFHFDGCANKDHLHQGLVVFLRYVQFGRYPYPFRTVLSFNIWVDVVTLQKSNDIKLELGRPV